MLYIRVQLTAEHLFHMVKIDDKAYMVSAEVSALFSLKEDTIRSKVSSFLNPKIITVSNI